MMDARNVLSRRSLLKASSFLAAAVVPVTALAAPAVPDVLVALMAEYAAAAKAVGETNTRFRAAQRARGKAIEEASLYFKWPAGNYGRFGETGNAYHPEYAMRLLQSDRVKALAASESAEAVAHIRKTYASTARQIRRQWRRYDAVVASTDWDAALEADTAAYHRFLAAHKAVRAYRPDTMAEVAAIIRCISAVGPYPGTHNGVSVRDLADMLDASGVAS